MVGAGIAAIGEQPLAQFIGKGVMPPGDLGPVEYAALIWSFVLGWLF